MEPYPAEPAVLEAGHLSRAVTAWALGEGLSHEEVSKANFGKH